MQQPLTVQELVELRTLGFTEAEIRSEVDRTGTRLTLTPAERATLAGAGFSPELIARLSLPAPTTPPATPGAATAPLSPAQQVTAAYGAPAALMASALSAVQLGSEAVFIASRATGAQRIVTTGTLTQSAPGRLEFGYSAQPADRLHVELRDGTTADYYVTRFEGDYTGGGAQLLNGGHDVALRAVVPGSYDLTLTSRRVRSGPLAYDGSADSSARGTLVYAGHPAEVELRATGTYYFETSFGGFESTSDLVTLGTLRLRGAELRLDERWQSSMISQAGRKGATTTEQSVVSSYVRTVNSTWTTAGGGTGAFRAGVTRTAFRDGVPSTNDERFWRATGNVEIDGVPLGDLVLVDALPQLKLLVNAKPEPVVLQVWQVPVMK